MSQWAVRAIKNDVETFFGSYQTNERAWEIADAVKARYDDTDVIELHRHRPADHPRRKQAVNGAENQ